jgi:branched-chain amino acid transport system substrate-binding protein
MVTGIASGKVTDRASMIEYFKTYDGQGIAKTYKWDSSGELAVANPWLYPVQ